METDRERAEGKQEKKGRENKQRKGCNHAIDQSKTERTQIKEKEGNKARREWQENKKRIETQKEEGKKTRRQTVARQKQKGLQENKNRKGREK